MTLIKTIDEMRKVSENLIKGGKKIGYVPTMGCLHKGHLSLIEAAEQQNDITIISIYVNPIQFGKGENFDLYPRDFANDIKILKKQLVKKPYIIFIPEDNEVFPEKQMTFVSVEEVTKNLCGIARPTHFRGVTTIVAKLFNIIKPHKAYFGEKDFQQLTIINKMVKDLNYDILIVAVPTKREDDGLAISSRNKLLNIDERKAALCLYKAIIKSKYFISIGVVDSKTILSETKAIIDSEKLALIEYIKLCDTKFFEDVNQIKKECLFALAVKIGRTRLIDNCILNPKNLNKV